MVNATVCGNMGTCFGRCLRRSSSGNEKNGRTRSWRRTPLVQEDSLEFFTLTESVTEDLSTKNSQSSNKNNFINRIFSKMEKRQKANKKKTVLGLAEELWSPMGDTNYHRLNESTSNCKIPISKSAGDISLQCLDARALLNRGGQNHSIMSSSTPPSSLDLEWEHEGLPSPAPWQIISESEDFINLESTSQATQSIVQPQPRCSSEVTNLSGWSRISTPDSLEWDPIQPLNEESSDLAVNEFDTETEQLLSEIERLTRTALKETGIELDR